MPGLDDKLAEKVADQTNVTNAEQPQVAQQAGQQANNESSLKEKLSTLADKIKSKIEEKVEEVVEGETPLEDLPDVTMTVESGTHKAFIKPEKGLNYNFLVECSCAWQGRFKHLIDAEAAITKHMINK